MKTYLKSLENASFLSGVDIDALDYTSDFSRKSQSIFQAYLLDVIATNPSFNYFQGFTQILAVMFFVFLKDECLLPHNALYNSLPSPVDDNFAIYDRNPADALENYEKLVQISVCLGQKCFGPQNSPGMQTLYVYQFYAFEPTLRFLDAELYVAITQKLRITSEILQSTLLSGSQFISHCLYSSLRFLDIAVLGDWHLQLFVAAAALVIAIRERGYSFEDEEFYVKAFTSLQTADDEISGFADKTIRLALAGYFMSFVSEQHQDKRNWRYIYENFSFSRVYGRVREFKGFETIIGKIPKFFDDAKAERDGLAEGFIDIDRDRERYIGMIQKSIAYQLKNQVQTAKMPALVQKSGSFVQKLKSVTNRWIEIGSVRDQPASAASSSHLCESIDAAVEEDQAPRADVEEGDDAHGKDQDDEHNMQNAPDSQNDAEIMSKVASADEQPAEQLIEEQEPLQSAAHE